MKHSTDRMRTTHTGALHRPPDLEELFRAKLAGEPYDDAELEASLKAGVAEVVRRQVDIGIDVIDDGEFSKVDFFSYAKYRISGYEPRPIDPTVDRFLHSTNTTKNSSDELRRRFADFYRDTVPPGGVSVPPSLVQFWMPVGTAVDAAMLYVCTGPLRYDDREVTRDIANLQAALSEVDADEAFLPVVAPAMFATRHPNEYYGSDEEYYYAVADVLHEEYRAITDAGFLLQIDDVSLPGRYRTVVPREGVEAFHAWADLAVDALNHALRGIPREQVRYHMCWSSQNSPHVDDPPLEEMVAHLLRIEAQGYQLEAANARHEHEWRVWKDLAIPDDRILMPGVICHATNVIEHPQGIADRLQRYIDIVGFERVIAATDCGFRWRVHPQIAWAKLEALVEGAELASAGRATKV